MGIFDLFKKKEKSSKEKIPSGLKWIYVSFVMYFDCPKKEIEKITKDIFNIINNTHSIVNYKEELVGHVNPYLNVNLASGFINQNGQVRHATTLYPIVKIPGSSYLVHKPISKKEVLSLDLSRPFTGMIEKMGKDKWKLTFVPTKVNKKDKTNLYSLPNLHHDFWELAAASDFISEKYNISINQEEPSFKPIMLSGAPALEFHDHLLTIIYHLHDKIASENDYPDLDEAIFRSHGTALENIKRISKDQPNSEWSKAAKKLLIK